MIRSISPLALLSAVIMIAVGLMTVINVPAVLLRDEHTAFAYSWTFIPSVLLYIAFGAISCIAAYKQLRGPALKWIILALGLVISAGLVYFFMAMIFIRPVMNIPAVEGFFVETMINGTLINMAVWIAIFALPLWSSYHRARQS